MTNTRIPVTLVVLLAVTAMASVAGTSHARPDPGEGVTGPAIPGRDAPDRPRPTGPAEHISPYAAGGATRSGNEPISAPEPVVPQLVAAAGGRDGFDWLAAAIGALTTAAAVALAAGALEARRRGRRIPQAM